MKRFALTLRAKQDLNDIWDYIAADNLDGADRVLDALDEAIASSPSILEVATFERNSPIGGLASIWFIRT